MEIPNVGGDKRKKIKGSADISHLVYGKVPPQATELERAILGAIMLESSAIVDASQYLFPEVFYIDAHQRIFKEMLALYDAGKGVDLLTVIESLRKSDALEIVGGAYAITKLTNDVVGSAHIEDHCKVILEKYMKREAIRIGQEFIYEAYEDYTDPFALYSQIDNEIINTQEKVLKGEAIDVSHYAMKVAEQHGSVKATGVLGISTHLRALDNLICGLVDPDLIIIAARPGQGKTAAALSIMHSTSIERDIPCGVFSLEMDGVQLVRRLASVDSGVSHEAIRTGTTSVLQDEKFHKSLERIANSPIYIDDKPALNIRDIRTRAFLLKRKKKIKYIVVDYIQLIEAVDPKGKSKEQIISDISRGLKLIAKELHIPVIALSQLSRKVEDRADKMPQLNDLRDSGAIEQDADVVIFIMRPEYYHFTEDVEISGSYYSVFSLAIFSIAKNRHGTTKNIPIGFNGPTMHFVDHPNDGYQNYTKPVQLIAPPDGYRSPYSDDVSATNNNNPADGDDPDALPF